MGESQKKPIDIISIPADEVIKLVFGADHIALIQFINSVFHKTYNADTDPLIISNAAFVNSETFDQIYGDFMFTIGNDYYHIEFQTKLDKTMLFRIFSYGSAKAKERALSGMPDDPIVFDFPQPLVVYLEENTSVTDELAAVLKIAGKQIEFTIPVIKMWKWPLNTLIEKEWYLLIPFTLIGYRKKFERVNGVNDYKDEFILSFRLLMSTISQLSADGKISRYLEGILYGAVKNLAAYFNNVYMRNPTFDLEVKTDMEGTFRTVLDDIRDEAREEARKEERQKAELEKAEILKQAEASKKQAEDSMKQAEASKKQAEDSKKQAEAERKELEAAKAKAEAERNESEAAAKKLLEQWRTTSIHNLKQRQFPNEEIAAILDLPLEIVEKVS